MNNKDLKKMLIRILLYIVSPLLMIWFLYSNFKFFIFIGLIVLLCFLYRRYKNKLFNNNG